MGYTPLPIGVDDFENIIEKKYYYVDKTLLIKELLDKKGEANLFTRPRRFGKTLNLSMLKYYFEKPVDGRNKSHLFDGLKIMEAGEEYTREQGKYPVIFLTFKSAKQPNWEMSYASMIDDIATEYRRHGEILQSDLLTDADKAKYVSMRDRKAKSIDYAKALAFLSKCLYEVHQKKVIILIDEYDVPLESSYYGGFYDEMVGFIRSLFESALKTNPFLEFAVITGCLRISKESIFTGLNNLEIISILRDDYDEYFGFTEEEVRNMLRFFGLEHKMEIVREWYDGYRFGKSDVYNPWSVINYVKRLRADENAFPVAVWSNTSSNNIVRDLINRASLVTRAEIESLMNGATIEKKVHEDITYQDIYETEENLWNFLFFTGYLKAVEVKFKDSEIYLTLAIPNTEVMLIYRNKIDYWFRNKIETVDFSDFYEAVLSGDAEAVRAEIEKQLRATISYMDSSEAFYHGFMMGILVGLGESHVIKSNRESGDGRYDICVYSNDIAETPVIFELKVAKKAKDMEHASWDALAQIRDKKYTAALEEEGYAEVICYGIGFFRKQLRIQVERRGLE